MFELKPRKTIAIHVVLLAAFFFNALGPKTVEALSISNGDKETVSSAIDTNLPGNRYYLRAVGRMRASVDSQPQPEPVTTISVGDLVNQSTTYTAVPQEITIMLPSEDIQPVDMHYYIGPR